MQAPAAQPFERSEFLAGVGDGRSDHNYRTGRAVFSQGEPADAVFYLQRGKVKLSLVSPQGKEAVIGILGAGDFFGEGCLAGRPVRMATATAMVPCSVARMERADMARALRDRPDLAERFLAHLLAREARMEEDLADQLFNSSEKRLARLLLILADFGGDGSAEPASPRMSQQTLADTVGTTRSRVSFFMNRFRRLGFVEYAGGRGPLRVNPSLLGVVLRD